MNHDEIDRVLSTEEGILPSSGFVASVMDVVQAEAATPAPIAFPWRRAWPGAVVAVLTVAAVLFACLTQLGTSTGSDTAWRLPAPVFSILKASADFGLGWISLSLLATLLFIRVSMRLAGAGQ